jgi:maltooligosyltrehalose trehalohydrolase
VQIDALVQRRYPIGAELDGTDAQIRVWAPRRRRIDVELDAGAHAARSVRLEPEGNGYFSAVVSDAAAGMRYVFHLDGEARGLPDPASRYQPEGPAGPSQLVDPLRYAWHDATWRGIRREGQVIYELHLGTFTREGTFRAASDELPRLADLGITTLEILPVAEFAGRFGWGYDGVHLWAPSHLYGAPDDLRAFVDRAHALGLGVILDVVYNHFGPACNTIGEFASDYFTDRHACEWGSALDFDGPGSGPVREFFSENAAYWIDEFHLDGLRLDATQSIYDASPEHILRVIALRARAAAKGRDIYLVAENEPQNTRLIEPIEHGGYGIDALWNDDFHHAARVALTGRREGYYSDYRGSPQELISAVRHGFLYQGQHYPWQQQPRGTPALHVRATSFVSYLENHDQVANSIDGARLHRLTSPGRLRAMTALLLLGPATPMLFQGQEIGSEHPFLYFADHEGELRAQVRKGRAELLSQFASIDAPESRARLDDPGEPQTFARCVLDAPAESRRAPHFVALHRDLLALRRTDPVFSTQRSDLIDGAVLANEAFVLRCANLEGAVRLLIVNLGADLDLTGAPEPLLAPPRDSSWRVLWSSESPRYGGRGARAFAATAWWITGHSAVVLDAHPIAERPPGAHSRG